MPVLTLWLIILAVRTLSLVSTIRDSTICSNREQVARYGLSYLVHTETAPTVAVSKSLCRRCLYCARPMALNSWSGAVIGRIPYLNVPPFTPISDNYSINGCQKHEIVSKCWAMYLQGYLVFRCDVARQ